MAKQCGWFASEEMLGEDIFLPFVVTMRAGLWLSRNLISDQEKQTPALVWEENGSPSLDWQKLSMKARHVRWLKFLDNPSG